MTKETKKKPSSSKLKTKKAASKETAVQLNSAKRKPNMVDEAYTEAFIREVDEDVKNDNLRIFWKKYGFYVVLLVIVSLTLAVSFESIKAWKIKRDQAMTNTYISTLEMKSTGRLNESLAMLRQIAEDGNGIYRDIAQLQVVNILLEQGKTQEALDNLAQIVNNPKINESYRAASRIKLVSLQFDDMETQKIKEILQPIEEDKNWAPYAKDFLAMAAIRDKNLEEAKEIYEQIAAMPDLSDDLRNRVQDIISMLDEEQ